MTAQRAFAPPQRSYTSALDVPSPSLEGAYYLYLLYANLAPDLGLVIPWAGLGSLMALTLCFVLRRGATVAGVIGPIRLPLACAISFVFVRVLVHGESIGAPYVREVPAWVCTLVIAQALCLRPGFLQRFPLAMFVMGLPSVRSLRQIDWGTTTSGGEEVVRAAGSGPLSNSNGMAFWFGFCCVYFAVLGLETRRMPLRVAAWAAAIACLFMVGITVSRGMLLTVAISVVIAFRRLMKRSALPVLLLLAASWLVYLLGIFDRAAGFYSARGLEETGRLLVWPLAFQRFLTSPWYGVADVGTFIAQRSTAVTPHNVFLFMGLAAGLVPLLFLVAYCGRAVKGVWHAHRSQHPDALFLLPLFVFVFMAAQSTNVPFLDFPFTVILAAALGAADLRGAPAIAPRSSRSLRELRRPSMPGRLAHAPFGHHSR